MKANTHSKLFLSLLLFSFSSFAQNLVPNYSFEDTVNCNLPSLDNLSPWFNPTGGSPDYYNSCQVIPSYRVPYNGWGYQPARTGVAYVGISALFFAYPPPNPTPTPVRGNILKYL